MSKKLKIFAMTAPGLESILSGELQEIVSGRKKESIGGLEFSGSIDDVMRANLWSRVANRVVVRVDEFHASTFHELERRAKRVEWARFVGGGAAVRFRVTCRKSKLYHSDAVAERFAKAVAKATGARPVESDADEDEASGEGQLFIVRIVNDVCTLSVDSSGELLHRRGYRQAIAKAPVRETIAAAMVIASEWDTTSPFVDPMCGAGTIAIEAAMIARKIAPGANRTFAFEQWPGHDAAKWKALVAEARSQELPRAAGRIIASDRDEGAIAATRANAERAGVAADIEASHRVLSDAEIPEGEGWLLTNPPYGLRIGESTPLRNLYALLGKIVREKAPGYRIGLLSADRKLESHVRMKFQEVFRTTNGGIPVRLILSGSD